MATKSAREVSEVNKVSASAILVGCIEGNASHHAHLEPADCCICYQPPRRKRSCGSDTVILRSNDASRSYMKSLTCRDE